MKDLTHLNDEPRRSGRETHYGQKLRFSAPTQLLKRLERLQAYHQSVQLPTALTAVFDRALSAYEAELETLGVLPPLD